MAKNKFNPNNGRDVINHVKNIPGVELHQKKNGMVQIKTPKGSMQITDSKANYSEHDKANVRKWMRLLGLLLLIVLCLTPFVLPHIL